MGLFLIGLLTGGGVAFGLVAIYAASKSCVLERSNAAARLRRYAEDYRLARTAKEVVAARHLLWAEIDDTVGLMEAEE